MLVAAACQRVPELPSTAIPEVLPPEFVLATVCAPMATLLIVVPPRVAPEGASSPVTYTMCGSQST